MSSADNVLVQSKLKRIKVSRLALGFAKLPKPKFDLRADMDEVGVTQGRLGVKFTISVETYPSVQRAEIEGTATITCDSIADVSDLAGLGEHRLMRIAFEIYRQNYECLALLFTPMKVEPPSPWVVRDVRLIRGERASKLGGETVAAPPLDAMR